MDLTLIDKYIEELSGIIKAIKDLLKKAKAVGIEDEDYQWMITKSLAAISRICPGTSYDKDAQLIINSQMRLWGRVRPLLGILEALFDDLKKGYLKGFVELIHADLFSDFLEMARHLLNEGFKDAAAVISGSSLEAHLHQLCDKFGIPPTDGSGKPLKATRINDELAKIGAYSKGDQKSVTAWLDLRNNAAHGKYKEYTKEQVALMIDAIRDFINRNPA